MPSLEEFDMDMKKTMTNGEQETESKIKKAEEVKPCAVSSQSVEPLTRRNEDSKPVPLPQAPVANKNANQDLTPASSVSQQAPNFSQPNNDFVAYVLGQSLKCNNDETTTTNEVPSKMKTSFLRSMMNKCFPTHNTPVPSKGTKMHLIVTSKEKIGGYFWAQNKVCVVYIT